LDLTSLGINLSRLSLIFLLVILLVTEFDLSLMFESVSVIFELLGLFKKFLREFLSEKSDPKIGEIGKKLLL